MQGVVKILDIGAKEVSVVAPLLKDLPDIIVGTPGVVLTIKHCTMIVH